MCTKECKNFQVNNHDNKASKSKYVTLGCLMYEERVGWNPDGQSVCMYYEGQEAEDPEPMTKKYRQIFINFYEGHSLGTVV